MQSSVREENRSPVALPSSQAHCGQPLGPPPQPAFQPGNQSAPRGDLRHGGRLGLSDAYLKRGFCESRPKAGGAALGPGAPPKCTCGLLTRGACERMTRGSAVSVEGAGSQKDIVANM